MTRNLNQFEGASEVDNLVISAPPSVDVFSVTVAASALANDLKRGTVLALSGGSAGTGKFVVLGTEAEDDEELTANAILADDVEAGNADRIVVAYRRGNFNTGALITAGTYTITDGDFEALRSKGIIASDSVAE